MELRSLLQRVARGEIAPQEAALAVRSAKTQVGAGAAREWPLSRGQEALWMAYTLAPDGSTYNVPLAQWVRAGVEPRDLKAALDGVLRLHPILASMVVERGGAVVQRAEGSVEVPWESIDADAWDDGELVRRARVQARAPFDLRASPPVRAVLFRRSTRPSLLLTCLHHIAFDGVSLGLLLRDWARCHERVKQGRGLDDLAPESSYAEFVASQEEYLRSGAGSADRAYWEQVLGAGVPRVELPFSKPRVAPATQGDSVHIDLDETLGMRIRTLARERGQSAFALFLAAYQVVLARYAQQDRVAVAVPSEGRPEAQFDDLIGYFVNVLPLATDVSDGESVSELLARTQATVFDALHHGRYPVFALARESRRSSTPTVGLYFQNWAEDLASLSGLRFEGEDRGGAVTSEPPLSAPLFEVRQEGELDVIAEVFELRTGYGLAIKFNPALYERDAMDRLGRSMLHVLRQMVDDQDRHVGELEVVTPEERSLVLGSWNGTARPVDSTPSLLSRVGAWVASAPERIATQCGETVRTYRDLDATAGALAAALIQKGVRRGDIVGVQVDRTADLPAVLLGVLRAGAAYLPLDPTYPPERLAFMLEDSKARVAVTSARGGELATPGLEKVEKVDLAELVSGTARTAEVIAEPTDPAYVIYTSGSTGKPKGVRVLRGNLDNFVTSMIRSPGFTRDDCLAAVTTICFDIAGLELFVPLSCGARIEVVSAEEARDGVALRRRLESCAATVMQATPATWSMLLRAGWERPRLRAILCGGEGLPAELAKQLRARSDALYNMYGPTETTIWSTMKQVTDGDVTIGRPIDNTTVYVVDGRGRLVPVGVTGELCIGGAGVAGGYLDRPELTRDRFVPNPFHPSPWPMMYRTGDVARFRADGELECLGRLDGQVKVRGHRVELQEIEAVLRSRVPDFDSVAVVVRKTAAGSDQLVAFAVTRDGGSLPDAEALRGRLAQWVPEYMVPSRFVALRSYPTTSNNKLDRKALATEPLERLEERFGAGPNAGKAAQERRDGASPKAALVGVVLEEVARVLEIDRETVDPVSPFGAQGLDSIGFTALAVSLTNRLGFSVSPALFFQHSTVETLAAYLARSPQAAAFAAEAVRPALPAAAESAAPASRTEGEQRVGLDGGVPPPVAIVGVALRLPGADDLEQLWRNLTDATDGITETPADRWDWRTLPEGEHARWGGYIEGVESFDAPFFGLSPREAEQMDPQQRVVLESAWAALEDAGERPEDLRGSRTGVFIGVSGADFVATAGQREMGGHTFTGMARSIIANRISYLLDLRGPSAPIDTACSSSLVALHRAVRAIQQGECDAALAGGVNLILGPFPHVAGHRNGMMSPDGRCKAFDAAANGYVRGEGVATLFLKPLDAALRDGNHVHAVIAASAENHGGRANTLTSPNAEAQSDVVARALRLAGWDPRTVEYVETHGTGTPLGDPIEVEGLKAAFSTVLAERGEVAARPGWCALGSVKTNIGHLEAAAGVAGLLKAVLCVREGGIPALVHFREMNPHLQLEGTPFRLARQGAAWSSAGLRRAGVSSFGMGGANAHVLVEQFVLAAEAPAASAGANVFVYSAQDPEALRRLVGLHRRAIADRGGAPDWLERYASTLQRGRASLRERLAVVAETAEELEGVLARWETGAGSPELHQGTATRSAAAVSPDATVVRRERAALAVLASSWVRGATVGWDALYAGRAPRRLPLPTYPFTRTRYAQAAAPVAAPQRGLRLDFTGDGRSRVMLSGREFFLVDHRVQDHQILPGVIHLELAARCAQAAGRPFALASVLWSKPVIADGPTELEVRTRAGAAGLEYEIGSPPSEGGARTVYSQGRVQAAGEDGGTLDVASARARCGEVLGGADCYAAFARFGFVYGARLQAVATVAVGPSEAIAELKHPLPGAPEGGSFLLDPAALDAALQVASVLLGKRTGGRSELYLPFAVDRTVVHGPLDAARWIQARERGAESADGVRKLDIAIADAEGRVLVTLDGFSARRRGAVQAPAGEGAWPKGDVVRYRPTWGPAPLHAEMETAAPEDVLLFASDPEQAVALGLHARVAVVLPGDRFERIGPREFRVAPEQGEGFGAVIAALAEDGFGFRAVVYRWHELARDASDGDGVRRAALGLFHLAQALLAAKMRRRTRLLCAARARAGAAVDIAAVMQEAMGGFTRSVARETDRLELRGVGFGADASEGAVALHLWRECLADATSGADVRYEGDSRQERVLEPASDAARAAGALRTDGTYLITGGSGALGRLVAAHLGALGPARLALLSRGAPRPMPEARSASGSVVEWFKADLTRAVEVDAALTAIRARLGPIHGVFHTAGALDDGYLVQRSAAGIERVLGAKVLGLLTLDRLLSHDPLELMVLFGSTSGALGSPGQSDYAFANAFLRGWAGERERLRQAGVRPGRTLCIDWPYWADGGMRQPEAVSRAMFKELGAIPMPSKVGLDSLDRALAGTDAQITLVHGDAARLRTALEQPSAAPRAELGAAAPSAGAPPAPHAAQGRDPRSSARRAEAVRGFLRTLVARSTKLAEVALRDDGAFQEYGVDSVMTLELNAELERHFGALPKTLFFEHPNIEQLAAYFVAEHAERLSSLPGMPVEEAPPSGSAVASSVPATEEPPRPGPAVVPVRATPAPRAGTGEQQPTDIAVVGLAGRYPKAPTLEEFWRNLQAGRDCIDDVPIARWDLQDHFDPTRQQPGTSYSRWGGFLDGVDEFDPLFFSISPFEAQLLDPQERLFLQTVWHTIEDAGYTRAQLSRSRVGVYVGAMWGQYQLYAHGKDPAGGMLTPASSYASIANRVSYFFNFRGPSIALDTMCSSSLTALHLACEAISRGEIDAAVAGGVNVSVHPAKYVFLSQTGFAASDGRCRSFGSGGDGYVPGEGVGAVLLKPLARATQDGDRILAVIKATSINHGGRANGYTVPNPNAQAEVIQSALRRAGFSSRSVSYVEAHGTGTSLGDPIEIRGLVRAFADGDASLRERCAIGSVKSNIGHLESAAGMAALTKVLLQLRHRQLVPSLHCDPPNENIDFEATPFRVQRQLAGWAPAGDGLPLRAAISSFGAGGANAHLLVEEYQAPPRAVGAPRAPELFVLSARNRERLREYARSLLARFSPSQVTTRSEGSGDGGGEVRELVARLLEVQPDALDLSATLDELGLEPDHLARLATSLSERSGREVPAATLDPRWTLARLADVHGGASSLASAAVAESEEAPSNDFADVAFTLQTGREAMDERLTIIADDPAGLCRSLEAWLAGQSAEGVVEGSLSSGPGRTRTLFQAQDGREFIERLLENGRLRELALVWTEGAEVDFSRLKRPARACRVEAPKYPFEREPCRLPFHLRKVTTRRLVRPLVEDFDPRLSAGDGLALRSVLRPSAMWARACARSQAGEVPLAGVVELLAEAFEQVDGRPLAIERLICSEPATLGERGGPFTLRVRERAEGAFAFELAAEGDRSSSSWAGVISAAEAEVGAVSLAEVQQGMRAVDAAEYYAALAARGLRIDEASRCVEAVQLKDGEALADVTLPRDLAGELDGYLIHPAVLDVAFQLASVLLSEPDSGGRVAVALDRLEVVGPIPQVGRVYAKRTAQGAVNAVVVDTVGRMVVRVHGIQVEEAGDALRNFFDVPVLAPATGLATATRPASALILHRAEQRGLAEALAAELGGARVERRELSEPTPSPVELGDSEAVYFLSGMEIDPVDITSTEAVDAAQRRGVGALLPVLQALGDRSRGGPTSLVVVTNRVFAVESTDRVQPSGATMIGLCRSASREMPAVSMSLVDLEVGASPAAWPQAAREILGVAPESPAVETVVRQGVAHRRRLHPLRLPSGQPTRLRRQGVYAILGGLGNVGFKLAEFLAARYGAKIALIGRRPESEAVRSRLATLASSGGEAIYLQCDIGQPAQIAAALAAVRAKFGGLHGVFHSAMHFEQTRVRELDSSTLYSHLSSKVQGTVALQSALRGAALDMVVYFSSGESFTGSVGWGSYAAGAQFEDAFARAAAPNAGFPVQVINWGFWDGDLGEFGDVLRGRGIRPIEAGRGMAALERIVAYGVPQAMALDVDAPILERMGVDLSRRFTGRVAAGGRALELVSQEAAPPAARPAVSAPSTRKVAVRPAGRARPIAASAPVDIAELTTVMVRDVFATALKIKASDVQPQRSFSDYGADSLVITQVHKAFEERLGKLPATFLLENDSVAAATRFLLAEHRETLDRVLGAGAASRGPHDAVAVADIFGDATPVAPAGESVSPPEASASVGAALLGAYAGKDAEQFLASYGEQWSSGALKQRKAGAAFGSAPRNDARAETALSHHLVRLGGGQVVEAFTVGRGSPVLLIPPIGLTAPVWHRQIAGWAEDHQLIVVHPPGYGLSDPQKDTSSRGVVSTILQGLDALQVHQPVHVIGSCFGGVAAQYLAAHHGERVASLTLVGGFYRNFGLPDMPVQELTIEQMAEATAAVGASIQRDFEIVRGGLPQSAPDGALTAARDLLLRSQCAPPTQVMRYIAEILRFEGLSDLERVRAPALCIAGTLDTIVSPETAGFMASHLTEGRHVLIDGAGHYPYLTHHERFAPLVLEFIGSVDRQHRHKAGRSREEHHVAVAP